MTFTQLKKEFSNRGYEVNYSNNKYWLRKNKSNLEHEYSTRAGIETQLEMLVEKEREIEIIKNDRKELEND